MKNELALGDNNEVYVAPGVSISVATKGFRALVEVRSLLSQANNCNPFELHRCYLSMVDVDMIAEYSVLPQQSVFLRSRSTQSMPVRVGLS